MVTRNFIFIGIFIFIITLGVLETGYINKQFAYFEQELDAAIENVQNNSSSTDIIEEITQWWHKQKKKLNSFIPHNEIKDIDSLISEARSLISTNNLELALSKLQRLKTYAINIPNNFTPHFENIF